MGKYPKGQVYEHIEAWIPFETKKEPGLQSVQ